MGERENGVKPHQITFKMYNITTVPSQNSFNYQNLLKDLCEGRVGAGSLGD